MITVAVVNTKGGVGKTTLAAALAVRAAQESKRVAMVDLDPQKSLIGWWQRRGQTENPRIFAGADTAAEAIEKLDLDGWDWVFLDGPPAFLSVIKEAIEVADLCLIPVKPSMLDLLSTQDAVVLAREAGAEHLCVFNDVGSSEKKVADNARGMLLNFDVPIAETQIIHRVAHIASMTLGKSAAEVGKDEKAAAEIEALWQEVKSAARKAATARRAKQKVDADG